MKWREDLYIYASNKHIAPEIVRNAETFPDLIETYFAELLNHYGYREKEIMSSEDKLYVYLGVKFKAPDIDRQLTFYIMPISLYPDVSVTLTRYYRDEEESKTMALTKFLVPKSNGKINYANFNLENYSGDFEERVKQFSEFLQNQLRIRGSHFIAGTGWSDNYGISW